MNGTPVMRTLDELAEAADLERRDHPNGTHTWLARDEDLVRFANLAISDFLERSTNQYLTQLKVPRAT